MVKKPDQLRLVDSQDSVSVFDDLDALRQAQAAPTPSRPASRKHRRPKITTKFVAITHVLGRRLWEQRVSATAWFLLVELDRLIHEPQGRNPLSLTTMGLASTGLTTRQVDHALRQLEGAGAVAVERHRGRAPVVEALWYREL